MFDIWYEVWEGAGSEVSSGDGEGFLSSPLHLSGWLRQTLKFASEQIIFRYWILYSGERREEYFLNWEILTNIRILFNLFKYSELFV